MAGHEFSHGDVLQGREVLTVRRMGPEAGRVDDLLGASCERVVEGDQHAELRVAGIVDGPNEIAHVGRGGLMRG